MQRILIIAIILTCFEIGWNNGLSEEVPRLESSLDRDTVAIGDPIRYTLRVAAPPASEVIFPAYENGKIGDFEILEAGEGTGEDGFVRERWHLLQGFETGEFTLPAAEVTIHLPGGKDERLESAPLAITVNSLLDQADAEADIRGLKPQVGIPVFARWVFYLAAGVLVLVVLVIILIRKAFRKKEKSTPSPPPRPAHEIAYERLNRIREDDLPSRGLIKEYYTRVSNVVRQYLENRFGLRAPERTTEEFLHDMASTDCLSIKHQDLVGAFLGECDLVKFARYGPTEKEIEGVYDAAVTLVDETKEENKE